MVTSIIVIRKHGLASMGICAAIASNIFAIVVGLGLPWFLQCLINWGKTGNYQNASVSIKSDALPYTSALLLITIFALLFTFRACKWKIYKKFSLVCVIIHIIFMAASISLELFIVKT
jgi:Ca2+/Na+ antiporter